MIKETSKQESIDYKCVRMILLSHYDLQDMITERSCPKVTAVFEALPTGQTQPLTTPVGHTKVSATGGETGSVWQETSWQQMTFRTDALKGDYVM